MASTFNKDAGMSFSEWCDQKFTNMYSHDEFVSWDSSSPSHQPKNDSTSLCTSPKSTLINQPGGDKNLPGQKKSSRKVVSNIWTPSKNVPHMAQREEVWQPPASTWAKRPDFPNAKNIDTEKSCAKKMHKKEKTRTQSKDLPNSPKGNLQSRRRRTKSSQDAPDAPEVGGKNQETEKRHASFDSGSSESNSSKRNHSDLDLSPGNKQLKTKMRKNGLGGFQTPKSGADQLQTGSSSCVDKSCSRAEADFLKGHTEELASKANSKKRNSITVDYKSTGLLLEKTSQQPESYKLEQRSVKKGKQSSAKKGMERTGLKLVVNKQKYVPQGEFDVESWDSMADNPVTPTIKRDGDDDGSGSSPKTSGKLRYEDKSKIPSSDATITKSNAKQIKATLKKKSTSAPSDSAKTKIEKSTKSHTVKQNLTAPSSSTKDNKAMKTSPSPDEKSVPRIKNARTKCKEDISRAEQSQRKLLSPQTEGGLFLSKRVLQSVLGPSVKGGKLPRPKSAGNSKASDESTSWRVQQHRRKSWPGAKVHLDHIYEAFNFSAQKDELHGTLVPPAKQESKSPEKLSRDSFGAKISHSQLEKSLQQQSRPRTKNVMQPRSVFQILVEKSEKEQLEFLSKAESLKQIKDKVSQKAENDAKPTPRFTPRSLSTKKCISDDQSDKEFKPQQVSNDTPQKFENTMHRLQSELPCPGKKKDFILEWLDKHEESTPNTLGTVPLLSEPKETSRGGHEDLEAGELSDTSGSGDAWDTLIDGIMTSNNEEVFRRQYSNRVLPKRHVSPFKVASSPVDGDLKPFVSPAQKNIATVSPYYISPPTAQSKSARASTWTGPTPHIWDGDRDQTPPPLPYAFDRFSSEQNSCYVDQTMDGRQLHVNADPSQYGNAEAPGEYPWKRDGFQTPCNSTGGCESAFTFSHVHKIRSLSDNIPPRFLKRGHQRSRSSLPLTSHQLTSSPRCVYSSSSNQFTASRSSISPLSEVKTNPQSYRPWSTGSVGWSSPMSRTPGTITPTRFTPWTNEVTTSSPWKTYQRPHHPSSLVELTSVVDYPASSVPYIDTHCHIDFLYQRSDFRGTFKKFSTVHNFPGNYAGCLAVFCTPESFKRGAIWEDLVMEENIWVAFGCHPHHAKSYDGVVEENIIRCMKHPKAIALGEIGLDYSNRCTSDRPLQLQVFRRQLQIAVHMGKPLVIHSRAAEDDTLTIMTEIVPKNYKIHRHCFTGSPEEARRFFQAFPKAFIGLTALVTFPTAYPVHRTASEIPLEKILLETDAPYFLPKQCPQHLRWANPSMAVFVAARIAQLRGLPLDEVLYTVRTNTKEMYGI